MADPTTDPKRLQRRKLRAEAQKLLADRSRDATPAKARSVAEPKRSSTNQSRQLDDLARRVADRLDEAPKGERRPFQFAQPMEDLLKNRRLFPRRGKGRPKYHRSSRVRATTTRINQV